LFQAGCLTVDRILITGGGNKFCLRFPNLDVQAAMARLWLFLKKTLKNASLMKRQAQAMQEALIQRQAPEFQMALQTFFSSIPWGMNCDPGPILRDAFSSGQGYDRPGR
jgi:hypothetical protein